MDERCTYDGKDRICRLGRDERDGKDIEECEQVKDQARNRDGQELSGFGHDVGSGLAVWWSARWGGRRRPIACW